MSEAGFFPIGDLSLEYVRWPATRRHAPVLVLLHEGLGCVARWKSFPERLAELSGCETLAYSRAGYGRSSPITLPRPLDYHEREALDVLPHLLDQACRGEFVLVGHSDGASIALIYAGVRHDPRLRGLVLMAPHVLTEDVTVRTIREARSEYTAGALRKRLVRYHGDNVDCAFRGWSETWTAPGFADWNLEHMLPAIEVPVMTLRGSEDPYSSSLHVERIAAALGGRAESVGLAQCGHSPHIDQLEATLSHVVAFLDRL